MINNRLIKPLIIGILASILLVIFFFFGIFSYIDKPLAGYGDTLLHYFTLEHNFFRLTKLDFANYFDTRMFYPHKNTLALGNSLITQSILVLPIFLITKNAIMAANYLFIINPFLSFLAMYLLAYYLTKSISGAIIAGLFYAYNPFLWAHMTQMEVITIQWIPLIFLVTEMLIKRVSIKLLIILGLLFLIQLNSSLYYLFFLMLLYPIYLGIRVYSEKIQLSQFFPKLVLVGSLTATVGVLIFLKPYIEAKSAYKTDTSLETVNLVSAKLTDFLFTSDGNKLYGWMVNNPFLRSLRNSFAAEHPTEHTLFPGWTVLILFGIALFLFWKNKEIIKNNKFVFAYFLLMTTALILSFGPYIALGDIRLPSLYWLIFQIIPFADSFRAVSRFVVFANLALAVIIALGWQTFSGRIRKMKKYLIAVIIVIFMCLEFQNQLPTPYPISAEVLKFYSWLESQKNIKVILEVPSANGLWGQPDIHREFIIDSRYLLYGTLHSKKMVNGYSSYIPPDSIHLGDYLSVNFPNKDSLALLRKMGVDVIIVHADEYMKKADWYGVLSKFRTLKLKEVYKSANIIAFSYE